MTFPHSIPVADRVVITVIKRRHFDPHAIRAFLKALNLLGLAFGVRMIAMIQVVTAEEMTKTLRFL